MIESHIPCGFRCFTKKKMKEKYNISINESLPFDNGFLSPYSIKKLLDNEYININIRNTTPCIKTEFYIENGKKGIKFIKSSYDEIDNFIEKNGYNNKYLDSTKGYYTLLKDYDCILAHYNWHKSSSKKNIIPKINLKILEETINRRMERLKNIIKNSETINIYYDKANVEFIIINNKKFNLCKDSVKKSLIHTFSKYNKKIIYYEI